MLLQQIWCAAVKHQHLGGCMKSKNILKVYHRCTKFGEAIKYLYSCALLHPQQLSGNDQQH